MASVQVSFVGQVCSFLRGEIAIESARDRCGVVMMVREGGNVTYGEYSCTRVTALRSRAYLISV
jgi:hypothetical protein